LDADPLDPADAADPAGGTTSLSGQLLVATPLLQDGHFLRTVVLLVDHDEDGAIGVVLNRPTSLEVRDDLPLLASSAAEPAHVFGGGPVRDELTMALSGARGDGLCAWTVVDRVDPPDLPAPLRLFRGYAGWGPGQLEGELAEGAWWVVSPRVGDLFTPTPQTLWRDLLRRQGPPLAYASTWLADSRWN
jgi:putative transcriptional regulator